MNATLSSIETDAKPGNPLQRAWAVVRQNWRAYLILNALYYGIVIVGMIYVATNPALQQELMRAVGQGFSEGPLASVGAAYGGGQVIQAMVLTFVVNLLIGSFVTITLPSLVIPGLGLLMGVYRAILWGLLLSPADPSLAGPMIPHSLTLLLEGQAYIIALLAVVVHAKAFLWPQRVGLASRLQGYVYGLKQTGWLYVLVILLLLVAAIYEALEVIYLAPLFG